MAEGGGKQNLSTNGYDSAYGRSMSSPSIRWGGVIVVFARNSVWGPVWVFCLKLNSLVKACTESVLYSDWFRLSAKSHAVSIPCWSVTPCWSTTFYKTSCKTFLDVRCTTKFSCLSKISIPLFCYQCLQREWAWTEPGGRFWSATWQKWIVQYRTDASSL